MAKAKITPFAQVLRLLETLTDGEKATLRDVLRPAPTPRKSKQPSKKPKATNATLPLELAPTNESREADTGGQLCAACGNVQSHEDHSQPSPHYHAFDAGKKSAKSAA